MAEVPDDPAAQAVASLEARVAEAMKSADGVRSSVGKTAGDLGQLKTLVEGLRTLYEDQVADAQRQTASLAVMQTRASEALKAIEEYRRRADSESGFAFNAKGNAEEHAKAIAQLRGNVDATFAGLAATRTAIEDASSQVTALRASADTEAKSIANIKALASSEAAAIVAAGERVKAVMPAIDEGAKDANTISAAKSAVEAAVSTLQSLHAQIGEAATKALAEGASVSKADTDARALLVSMAEATASAQDVNTKVADYEARLEQQARAFAAMLAKLDGLLPHATSASLASAFHSQRERFAKPQPYWLGLFVGAILFLLLAAGYGLPAGTDSWDAILRHFINRLPIVAPLVWLAIYAGHQYNMALRMEEDYAFKAAVSTAFEGYKREMHEIPAGTNDSASPLLTLCENVLQALAERPGRIYEGRTEVVTPLTPLLNTIKDTIADAIRTNDKATTKQPAP